MANLALFDFDGTITTRETMPDFMRQAVPPRRQAWGRWLLAPVLTAYKLGMLSGVGVRNAVVRVGFSGVPLAAVQAQGERFAADTLPALLRPSMMQRITWHQAQGDTVVVVSGGLDVYLQPWCRAHGLALVCSSLAHRDGRLTGRYLGAQCVGAEKARQVRARYALGDGRQVYAYGDTHEDLALLELADHRFYRGQPPPVGAG